MQRRSDFGIRKTEPNIGIGGDCWLGPTAASAARIEDEVAVAEYRTEILPHFPAQELFIANEY